MKLRLCFLSIEACRPYLLEWGLTIVSKEESAAYVAYSLGLSIMNMDQAHNFLEVSPRITQVARLSPRSRDVKAAVTLGPVGGEVGADFWLLGTSRVTCLGCLDQSTTFKIPRHEVLSLCDITHSHSPSINGCLPAYCPTKPLPYRQLPRKACLRSGTITHYEHSQHPLSPLEQQRQRRLFRQLRRAEYLGCHRQRARHQHLRRIHSRHRQHL